MDEPASADSRLQLRLSKELMNVVEDTAFENDETVAELCRRAIAKECRRPELAGVRERGRPAIPVEVNDKNVVVVPAKNAWPIYNLCYAYVCQDGRTFRETTERFAFYCNQEIKQPIPKILEMHEHVKLALGANTGKLDALVRKLLNSGHSFDPFGTVYFLTPADSPETVNLGRPIPNDKKSKHGGTTAFVQAQRYVSLQSLKEAKRTSDLE